ncbi:MAG: SGNH/GDSL hydrolase family protein [Flavobacteriales bacterium]|nr:SGNH/GDSL hydrolase family protein [Flavobacteriales bacterium]NCA20074.1 SGNH/GDSL hydrolase family protein [Crocinitomicaceae bacterium]
MYYPNYYSYLKTHFNGLINFFGNNATSIFYVSFISLIFFFIRTIYLGIEKKLDFKIYTIVFVVLLVLSELILRLFNFQPGIHTYYKHFHPVNKLWNYKSFKADNTGILRIDSKVRKVISNRISKNNPNYSGREYGEIYCLTEEYINLIHGKTSNVFARYYKRILRKKNKSELDSAVLYYVKNPINSDGFRGIEFKEYKDQKPTVLLLGDSFTFGHSAMPKTSSFADLLLAKGYVVYNTGISATDVAQYLAVAKKYIQKLKPDYVIVNFFIGNDITYYKRKVLPFKPVFYCTNAGNIYYFYEGKYYMTSKAAYNFVLSQVSIPTNVSIVNKIASKSVISSLAWGVMKKFNMFPIFLNTGIVKHLDQSKYNKPYCNVELSQIEKLCKRHNSKFILSCIPDIMSYKIKRAKDIPNLFEGLKYYEMNVSELDYDISDGHFNVQGHRRYAAFLDRLIKSKTK